MGSVGLLILFALVGAFICAKARSAGGAIAFAVLRWSASSRPRSVRGCRVRCRRS